MNPNITRALGVCGAAAPFIYLTATIVGGYLWSGYSHIADTVSTLTSTGAPNQQILTPLFVAYNVCVLLLAIGLYIGIKSRGAHLGSLLIGVAAVCGLVLYWFPQDYPQGPPTTFTGTVHVVIAAVIAFASLASVLIYGLTLRKTTGWSGFARFCLVWFPIALILGAFGAMSVTTSYAGLAERLSIGSILAWTELAALMLISKSKLSKTQKDVAQQ